MRLLFPYLNTVLQFLGTALVSCQVSLIFTVIGSTSLDETANPEDCWIDCCQDHTLTPFSNF